MYLIEAGIVNRRFSHPFGCFKKSVGLIGRAGGHLSGVGDQLMNGR